MSDITYSPNRCDAPAPRGAVLTRAEVIELITEASGNRDNIKIWTVTQGGCLAAFYITPRSLLVEPEHLVEDIKILCSGPGFYTITNTITEYGHETGSVQTYPSESGELLGSYNIESVAMACHYAFVDEAMARRYSEELKNDERYIKSVKDWHALCDTVFAGYDYAYDYDAFDHYMEAVA